MVKSVDAAIPDDTADLENPAIVQLDNISKVYGMGDIEVRALDRVNLKVDSGEYCSIMGPSGSGKSTAMNVIGCLDRPTSGRYYLDGIEVASVS
ncbi:MAG: ATP-binding cassette domain-containing protein, partial [Geitlerinemataceae cyanobacterium]